MATRERLVAIIDNSDRTGICDDCGIALRYEYHTERGGRYGSECIHRHIHAPSWLTFKARRDAEEFARRKRGFDAILTRIGERELTVLKYTEFRDGTGCFDITRYGEYGSSEVLEFLLQNGWEKKLYCLGGWNNRCTLWVVRQVGGRKQSVDELEKAANPGR